MGRFTRREQGSGVLGTIVIIVIVVAGLFAGYRYVVFEVHEKAMKDLVKNRADYAATYSDEQITTDIVQRAHDLGIAIERDSVDIYREAGNMVTIRVAYDDSLNLIVKKFYHHYDLKESAPLPR